MTSIFEGQPPKTRPFQSKTRVIWVRDPSRRRAKRTVDVQRGSVRNISPKVVLTRQRTKTASPKYKQRNRGHPTSYVVREGSLQNISPRVVFDPF